MAANVLRHQQVFKNGQEVKPPLDQLSILSLLKKHLADRSDQEALVYVTPENGVQERLTFADFFQQILAVAKFLQEKHHLKVGDAVGLHLENTPEIFIFHLACWLIGCKTVPLDLKRDDADRKKYKLTITDCQLVVISDTDQGKKEIQPLKKLLPELTILTMSQEIRQQLVEQYVAEPTFAEKPDNTALILFTSGTTNLPKGVQLSVANLLLNADGIKDWLEITEKDRFHIVLPLHHINSTTMSLATLLAGGAIVLSSRYSKSSFWQIMAENRCTLSSIVPTICFDMLSERVAFEKHQQQLKQVTRIQLGSAPVKPTDVSKFYDAFGIRLAQGYGSTETALRVTGARFSELTDEEYRQSVKANTIGNELKWNNIEVLKADGNPAAAEEEGEICIRGPIVTKGYLANEQANREAFIDGWFHSGDVGYWRELFGQKTFFISGRQKEIIIKGGVNISPLMIEHAVSENYPAVSTCFAAACPDERYGEEIGLAVVFEESISDQERQQLLEQIKKDAQQGAIKGVADYESPQYVFAVPLASLPKTSTGKIQRVKMKQYFTDMFQPIAETKTHLFRRLTPFDTDYLKTLVIIHNNRWGEALGMNEEVAARAVANGLVIGAIEKKTQQLVGSVFAEQVHQTDIENQSSWLRTYDSATGKLTLQPNAEEGDALLLVTVSTQGKAFEPSTEPADSQYQQYLSQADKYIDQYLATQVDPVLNFHGKAKAGMKKGAAVLYPISQARPADVEALGYCAMVKYPLLPETVAVQKSASLGTQLLEAAFVYAAKHNLNQVYAYSRPSGFLGWMRQSSSG